MHNFQLVNLDTDSITICKADQSHFSENEKETLLEELNSKYDPRIRWEDDGYYKSVVVLKIKNSDIKGHVETAVLKILKEKFQLGAKA